MSASSQPLKWVFNFLTRANLRCEDIGREFHDLLTRSLPEAAPSTFAGGDERARQAEPEKSASSAAAIRFSRSGVSPPNF